MSDKICLAFILVAFFTACRSSHDRPENSSSAPQEAVVLKQYPTKIKRSISGFTPVKYDAEIDLRTGLVQYNKSDGAGQNCKGSVDISNDLERWRSATVNLSVCFKSTESVATDGTYDRITLYYENGTELPEGIRSQTEKENSVVEIFLKFNDFVGGSQQFLCDQKFDLDSYISEAVDCI